MQDRVKVWNADGCLLLRFLFLKFCNLLFRFLYAPFIQFITFGRCIYAHVCHCIIELYFLKLSIDTWYKSANLKRTSVGTTNIPSSYLQIVLLLRFTILPRPVRLRWFCLRRRRKRSISIMFIRILPFRFCVFLLYLLLVCIHIYMVFHKQP